MPELFRLRNYKDRELGPIMLESCFERSLPPPDRFLRWLIQNPERMQVPTIKTLQNFGETTRLYRTKLFGPAPGRAEAQSEALRLLSSCGASKSSLQWWAFEGFTEVDCCIETDSLVLLFEGKRTEQLSSATVWFPQRNQLWRNVEVAASLAGRKRFGVIMIAEIQEDALHALDASYPHLDEEERKSLRDHYLGCLLWKDVCAATGVKYEALPNTVADARR